jgi:V/A-type H+-transporting ATPase subunit K
MIDAATLALFGVGISVGLGAAGSAIGTGYAARVGAGLLSKEPQKFPGVLILTALPSSQALYGLLYGIVILLQTGLLQGSLLDGVTEGVAFQFLASAIPVGLACLFSGIVQGQISAAGMKIIAEKGENLNQAIILSALAESFAIFGLIISILIAFVGITF